MVRMKRVALWWAGISALITLVGAFIGIGTFAMYGAIGFVVFWVGFINLSIVGIVVIVYEVRELWSAPGRVFLNIDLVKYVDGDVYLVGFIVEPGQVLPDVAGSPTEDHNFVERVKKLNEEARAHDESWKDVDPAGMFEKVTIPDGCHLVYYKVLRVCPHLDEDLDDDYAGKDEVKVTKTVHPFNIMDAQVLLVFVPGDPALLLRPHRRVDDGLFTLFSHKVSQVKCDAELLKEVAPGVLVLNLLHTTQMTYDRKIASNAALNPDSIVVKAATGYCAIVKNKPDHLEVEIESAETSRDMWESKAIKAEDEKNAYIEEHEGSFESDEVEREETVIPPPEQRIGLGFAIGALTTSGFLLLLLQILSSVGIKLFG